MDRPEGIVDPDPSSDLRIPVRSVLKQVGSNNDADFLPGGYASSRLQFLADDTLKVTRTFGPDHGLVLTWRVSYQWNKDQTELRLGQDPAQRPDKELLRGFSARGGKVRVTPPIRSFPVRLSCERLQNGRIRIGNKDYTSETD